MQRDRVARAHFQDVRRAAIKVSPYHVVGSTGYLVATRHKWAPAEYRRADGHTRLIPAQWPCGADRREGIAVAEVYFMDSSSRHQSREGPLRQQIRIPGSCIVLQRHSETEHPMRRSRFTQSEILQLLGEASAGVPVAEICSAAGITPRTFYRWRRQFGGLDVPAVRQMKDLVSENLRLRGLVSNLFERLRTPDDNPPEERRTLKATAPRNADARARDQMRASRIAAEKCGGALTGPFGFVRG